MIIQPGSALRDKLVPRDCYTAVSFVARRRGKTRGRSVDLREEIERFKWGSVADRRFKVLKCRSEFSSVWRQ